MLSALHIKLYSWIMCIGVWVGLGFFALFFSFSFSFRFFWFGFFFVVACFVGLFLGGWGFWGGQGFSLFGWVFLVLFYGLWHIALLQAFF